LIHGLKARAELALDTTQITVDALDYRELCERLYKAGFDFPSSLTGTDFEWGLGVALHLQQLESKRKVVVRTFCTYEKPNVPTVSDLWGGVDWHEREAYDLVGIIFDGHYDSVDGHPRRILLEDHWTIHPLQRKYNTRGYVIPQWTAKPWPTPAPWEEGFTAFAATAPAAPHAAAAKAHAPTAATPISTASAVGNATPASVAAETKAANEQGASVTPAPSSTEPAAEAPKKVAKKWVPKGGTASTPASSETPSPQAVVAHEPVQIAQVKTDDLTIIEGIGPARADVLVAAGISSFAKLAQSNVEQLTAIMTGAHLELAPGIDSWISQADLLAKGDMDGFKALTESIIAGREDKPKNPKVKRWEPKN
jgi:NADH:ubiquinone oxidoreductase subunit C/predicted flap endonuclease-1-like 5' DNA nuclease